MINIMDNKKIIDFLKDNGINPLLLDPIKQDASNRRYFRIKNNKNTLLMDSKPIDNDNYGFIKVSKHLNKIGLSAPKVLKATIKMVYFS